MAKIPLQGKTYITVDERLSEMAKDYKGNYSLVVSHEFEEQRVTATAKLTFHDSVRPGHTKKAGNEQVFIDSATEYGSARKTQEKCSTHAVGRVLSLAGYAGGEFGIEAPIASANEMQDWLNHKDDSTPITIKQIRLIEDLIKSHVITAEECTKINGFIKDPNATLGKAKQTIDTLMKWIKDRKEKEVEIQKEKEVGLEN